MVASSDPGWPQGAFSTLVGLFDQVGLSKNDGKTVGMVCCPCQETGTHPEAAYGRWMTGAGILYWERQSVRVKCLEYGEDMEMVYLAVHQQTQHRKASGGRRNLGTTSPGGEPQTYKMDLPTAGDPRNFPVEGVSGKGSNAEYYAGPLPTPA